MCPANEETIHTNEAEKTNWGKINYTLLFCAHTHTHETWARDQQQSNNKKHGSSLKCHFHDSSTDFRQCRRRDLICCRWFCWCLARFFSLGQRSIAFPDHRSPNQDQDCRRTDPMGSYLHGLFHVIFLCELYFPVGPTNLTDSHALTPNTAIQSVEANALASKISQQTKKYKTEINAPNSQIFCTGHT